MSTYTGLALSIISHLYNLLCLSCRRGFASELQKERQKGGLNAKSIQQRGFARGYLPNY
jgi:hypothetical protein